jgi:hypothetical protein
VEVERAVNQSEVRRLFDLGAVEGAIARAGRRRGAAVLGAVLADYAGPTLTEEGLEERFLALCRRIAYKADFLWRSQRLVVETDGRDVHSTRRAFDEDRLRDQRLALAGFTVVRVHLAPARPGTRSGAANHRRPAR